MIAPLEARVPECVRSQHGESEGGAGALCTSDPQLLAQASHKRMRSYYWYVAVRTSTASALRALRTRVMRRCMLLHSMHPASVVSAAVTSTSYFTGVERGFLPCLKFAVAIRAVVLL